MYVRLPVELIPIILLMIMILIMRDMIARRRKRKAEMEKPRQQAMARVEATQRYTERVGQNLVYRYYATFRLHDEQRLTFAISEWEWERLEQGDTGELTWQGSRFLFFARK